MGASADTGKPAGRELTAGAGGFLHVLSAEILTTSDTADGELVTGNTVCEQHARMGDMCTCHSL